MRRTAERLFTQDRAVLRVCLRLAPLAAVALWMIWLAHPVASEAEDKAEQKQPATAAVLLRTVNSDDVPAKDVNTSDVDTGDVDTGGHASGSQAASQERYETKSLRGRVVWMADALAEHYGIATVAEARERVLALETADGHLYPIMEDVRGRAFRRDKRLREMDLELLVRQYEGSPMVQVIRTYALDNNGKYELDYWCEICSIAMVELKACDCCQGPTELRRRKVEVKVAEKRAQRP